MDIAVRYIYFMYLAFAAMFALIWGIICQSIAKAKGLDEMKKIG